ncbi:MAG: hydrogenase maturation protease [Thermoplasmata archaeon]
MHKLRDASGDTEENLKRQLKAIVGNSKIYVLGLGNTDRADDGAGVLVAEALKKSFPSYSCSEHDGVEGTVLGISERDDDVAVVFVDAGDLRLAPGTIRIVECKNVKEREITTHRVAVALMASLLSKSGKKSAVVCIQPKRTEFGAGVSPEVTCAIGMVIGVLEELMESRNLS